MRYLLFFSLFFKFCFADAVIVSVATDLRGYKAKKVLKKTANEDAIKKYILKKNKNIDPEVISKLQQESNKYILMTTLDSLEASDDGTSAVYSVEVDNDTLNQILATYGQSIQGISTEIVLAELPVNLENIEYFSKQDFLIYYQSFEKKIKSTINRKLDESGLKTIDLSKNKNFSSYKTYGTYYDPSKNKYVVDQKFYRQVAKEYPNAIVMKYQINSFSIANQTLQASLSLEVDDELNEKSINLGSLEYSIHLDDFKYNTILNGFSKALENIVSLMSSDVNEKLSTIIETRNNMPTQIVINVASKRIAYAIKSALKSNENILESVVSNNQLKLLAKSIETEKLIYEDVLPVVEDKINGQIADKYINLDNRKKIIINGGGEEFDNNNIVAILYI